MNKKLVILYGPPGAGKDTQAEKVSERYGLPHFKTSKVVGDLISDPSLENDPIIQREKKNRLEGRLWTPAWLKEIVREQADKFLDKSKGVVMNGSPRTLEEAKEIIPYWENKYGKENIFVVEIKIKPETTIFRNTHRKVCQKCDTPLIYSKKTESLTECPICGGLIVERIDDKEEIIKVRLAEYKNHTEPIFNYLKNENYLVIEIDGEPAPEEVTEQIFSALDKALY